MTSQSRITSAQAMASAAVGAGVARTASLTPSGVPAGAPPSFPEGQLSPGIRTVDRLPTGSISPVAYRIRRELDVLTPMRDGVRLAMDLVRPDTEAACPVVLIRTPYDKVPSRTGPQIDDLAQRGYIVAIQDCRGRFNSDGAFDPYRQEHNDGFDTVEWIARQPWCTGSIGMIGRSYVGQTQWLAA